MQTITISTFTYNDSYSDLFICATCAHKNPDINPTPYTYTHDFSIADSPSLCDYCHTPIIDIA